MYIIFLYFHSFCGKNCSYSPTILNLNKFSYIYVSEHHFVMFPLTTQQKQVLFGCNLESDQISPACTLMNIILSYSLSIGSKNKAYLAAISNMIKFPLHVNQCTLFCQVSIHYAAKKVLFG